MSNGEVTVTIPRHNPVNAYTIGGDSPRCGALAGRVPQADVGPRRQPENRRALSDGHGSRTLIKMKDRIVLIEYGIERHGQVPPVPVFRDWLALQERRT